MSHRPIRKGLNKFASYASAISLGCITLLGSLLKADSKLPPPPLDCPCPEITGAGTGQISLAPMLDTSDPAELSFIDKMSQTLTALHEFIIESIPWIHQNAVTLILVFATIAIFAGTLQFLTRDLKFWKAIDDFLNVVRTHLFKDAYVRPGSSEPDDCHRVTLFVYKKWKWWIWPWRGLIPWGCWRGPGSGWLVPVARTGHATQRLRAVFLAPDDAVNAEGIAGVCWRIGAIVYQPDLPDMSGVGKNDPIVKTYCEKSFTPEPLVKRRLRKNESLPRALAALVIKEKSKPWGVVVLDSQKPDGIKSDTEHQMAYELVRKLTTALLENSEISR